MADTKDLKEETKPEEEVVDDTKIEVEEKLTDDVPDNDTLTKEKTEEEEEVKEEVDTSAYPEGLDETMYDLEKGTFKEDGVIAKIKELENKIKVSDKRVESFRKIVSKGKAPKDITAYDKYAPEERFERFFNFEDKANDQVKNSLGKFNEVAFELGLNEAQHEKVANHINDILEANDVLDTRSTDDIKTENKVWLDGEKAKIANTPQEADAIISKTVSFVQNYNMLNEDEKKHAIETMNKKGAVAVGLWAKIESLFNNDSVPVSHSDTSGLAADDILAKEYKNPETSDSRRQEIIIQRDKAGRNNTFLSIDN